MKQFKVNQNCHECGQLLKYCQCEELYNEQDLIDFDDDLSFSAIDFET